MLEAQQSCTPNNVAGLGACQCRVPQAMERHVARVLPAFVVLQQLRLAHQGRWEVKLRLHLTVIRGDVAIASPKAGKIMAAA